MKEDKTKVAGKRKASALRLVHELEVHQAELTAQNEELKAARAETESALERYTELFDFAPIGYAMLAPDVAIQQINHAGARLLGRPRRELVGRRFTAHINAGDCDAFSMAIAHAAVVDERESIEILLTPGAESWAAPRRVRLSAVCLRGAGRGFLIAFEDITEQKAKELKLADAEAELRDVNRRKDEFLAMLSHELRNPLAPIRSGLAVLRRAEPGSERATHAQEVLDRQVTHLSRLVDDLLDVTRILRGKIELRPETLELGALVRRTLDDHRESFEACGLRCEIAFEEGPFWIVGDPLRLVQAIGNVVSNAVKFTERGGSIIVRLTRKDGSALLRVRDTGSGIPADLLAHVFEPFAQAPQTVDRARGGLGLGLAMVKAFVELHGGTIALRSQGRGLGTEVTLSLPLANAPAAEAAPGEPQTRPRRRILIIEDNTDAADMLREELVHEGHDASIADNGSVGIAMAHELVPDVVICDIGLPGVDGYEVARALRRDPTLQKARLIAVTGYARAEDRRRAVEAGFDLHLAKPVDFDELDRLLEA